MRQRSALLCGSRFRTLSRVAFSSLLVGALYACLPTQPCACPPARTHAVVFGTVTRGGVPLQDVRVQAAVFRETCGSGYDEMDPDANPVRTNAAGNYELRFHSLHGPRTACLRVSAIRGSGSQVASIFGDTQVTLRNERTEPERVRVDLVFP